MPHSVLVERIKLLANQKGISLKELQRQTGLSTGAIWSWDNYSPTVKKLIPIAEYFGVSLDYLCGLDEIPCIQDYPQNVKILIHMICETHFTDQQAKTVIDYIQALTSFNSETSFQK